MTNDDDRKGRLSFAIFWAMWKRDVSPPQIALAIGKDAQTVRRWRDGETAPSVLDVGPLARALGVRVDFFTNPPAVPDYPFDEFIIGEDATRPGQLPDEIAAAVDSRVPEITDEVRALGRIRSVGSAARPATSPKRSSAPAKRAP